MLKANPEVRPEIDAASATRGPPSERITNAARGEDAQNSGGTAAAEWAGTGTVTGAAAVPPS
jgi:hypothetical protein